ncbi:hypothetical protein BDZ45DRAFT_751522 [Acephala macrosclerotiorum]|nr:hypothetical protein BDZ45DRAFT_751522 [Acephala macrosclerotiorum]
MAVKVGCGVTFTFEGLAVDPKTAGVISNFTGKTAPGAFCAEEMVGALFYEIYPGGSGLTSVLYLVVRENQNTAANTTLCSSPDELQSPDAQGCNDLYLSDDDALPANASNPHDKTLLAEHRIALHTTTRF